MHDAEKNLKKDFKDTYRSIKAPEDLKKDTLKRMLEEEEKGREKKAEAGRRKLSPWHYGTMAAALCVAVLGLMALRPAGISYVTPMEEGVYYDEVELKNGVIRFEPGRVAISITPNAGQAAIGWGESAQKDLSDEKEAGLMEETKSKSGGELRLFTADALSLPAVREDSWSYIGEQKIYVSVLKTENTRYQAVYEKEGLVYEVTGTNVTQKEFIDYLYLKIKK